MSDVDSRSLTESKVMTSILSVRKLTTGYGKKPVLFDVSFDVEPGEIIVVAGGNGSGKSTLLKAIFGLIAPWNPDAEIIFRPDPTYPILATHPPILNLSKGLAYLPHKNAVFDDLTVEENLRLSGYTLRDREEFAARREEVLALVPALGPLLHSKPERMSGGERQMAALAMVLLHRPRLLLLDEPTAGLTENLASEIFRLIGKLRETTGFAAVVVEHRLEYAQTIASRMVALNLGKLESVPTGALSQSKLAEEAGDGIISVI